MARDGDKTDFSIKEVGSLYFQNRLCVSNHKELKKSSYLKLIIRYFHASWR